MAKDISFARLFDSENIGEKIDYDNIHSNNILCQTKINDFFEDMQKMAEYNKEIIDNADIDNDRDPSDDFC